MQLHTYVEAESLVSAQRRARRFHLRQRPGRVPRRRLTNQLASRRLLPECIRCHPISVIQLPASEEEEESSFYSAWGSGGASSSAARLRATSVPRCPPPFARQAASPRDPGLRTPCSPSALWTLLLRTPDVSREDHRTGRMRNVFQILWRRQVHGHPQRHRAPAPPVGATASSYTSLLNHRPPACRSSATFRSTSTGTGSSPAPRPWPTTRPGAGTVRTVVRYYGRRAVAPGARRVGWIPPSVDAGDKRLRDGRRSGAAGVLSIIVCGLRSSHLARIGSNPRRELPASQHSPVYSDWQPQAEPRPGIHLDGCSSNGRRVASR